MHNVHIQIPLGGKEDAVSVAFDFPIKLTMTCKILSEDTALGVEHGREVEDDGEGAGRRGRRRLICFTILIPSLSLLEAGGEWRDRSRCEFPALEASLSIMCTHDHKGWDPSFLLFQVIPRDLWTRYRAVPAMHMASLVFLSGMFPEMPLFSLQLEELSFPN